jgi:hypothetical protein
MIAAAAIATTALALMSDDDALAMVLGAVGVVAWGMVAYGALDVRVVGDSVTYSFGMPAVTIFAVAMALVPGFVLIAGPPNLLGSRVRDPRQDEL